MNCKPTELKAGDQITYRKGDGILTLMHGPELIRFRVTNDQTDPGERKITFGRVENPKTFFDALRTLVSALTGFDTRIVKTGSAYWRFELTDPSKGDGEC